MVFAWFLVQLATAIVDKINNNRELINPGLLKGQLNEVIFRLVFASFCAVKLLGKADQEFLKCVKDSLVLYQGNERTENLTQLIEQL